MDSVAPVGRDGVMLIHGHYRMFKRRLACQSAWCTRCRRGTIAEGMEWDRVMHLFFIPLLKTGQTSAWICRTCGEDIDVDRPKDPGVIRRYAKVGWLLFALGLVIAAADWNDHGSRFAGLTFAGFSLGFVGVSEYWRRKAIGVDYAQDVASVPPLKGDCCPLCQQPSTPGNPPHCEPCKVAIVTTPYVGD